MKRILLALALLATTLSAPLVAAPVAAQQNQQADLTNARSAAQQILQLATDRKFNAMVDLLHPDALAIVPRQAAIGAFTAAYGTYKVSDSKITDGRMTSYTWPVTGQTYPNAAEFDFQQVFTDPATNKQQILSDQMYLAQAPDGSWRWFFGNSPDMVRNAIATYGGQQGTPLVQGDLLTNVVTDLDSFYRDVISYTDKTYQSPGVVLVQQGDSVQTGCGPAATGFWAFYCPPDATLYLDEALLTQLQQQAPFAAAFVIAHEWAHHIQTIVGFDRVGDGRTPTKWNQVHSIDLELMADCMSGAWAQDVNTRGLLQTNDIQDTANFAIQYLGDPPGVDTYDPQAHGSADMRVNAIMDGFNGGFLACNITI